MSGESIGNTSGQPDEKDTWKETMSGERIEGTSQDNAESQAGEDRIDSLRRATTEELVEHEGVRLEASFLVQKNYGRPMEEVTADEFWNTVGNGIYLPPEKSGHDTREFINALQNDKIYEIKEVCLSKGRSMPAQELFLVSQYHFSYVIRRSSYPIKWKVVLSREDGEKGGLVFTDGASFEKLL